MLTYLIKPNNDFVLKLLVKNFNFTSISIIDTQFGSHLYLNKKLTGEKFDLPTWKITNGSKKKKGGTSISNMNKISVTFASRSNNFIRIIQVLYFITGQLKSTTYINIVSYPYVTTVISFKNIKIYIFM
jgi:hypothetical protein